jgi:histidyl-tRNA synthetase
MPEAGLPGFRDFYPAEFAERAFITRTWRDVARRYALVEYDGPPLEPLELYTRKSGDEIVGQLYNFTDKGGREVALRPEMTPTLARMVAARANALRKPVRWFSIPQLFRYERAQRGRLREHFQLNVDLVGVAEIDADAELIACAVDVMRAFGLRSSDVVVRVSDRRLLQSYLLGLGVAEGALVAAYGVIDKLERTPRDVSLERLSALGISDESGRKIVEIASLTLDDLESATHDAEGARLVADFRRLVSSVQALLGGDDGWMTFDMSVVRGLAYYTGVVFELFDRGRAFRAICGGGRYDNLLSSLGGPALPALGFGMGDVVLGELLREKGLLPPGDPAIDYWIAGEGEGEEGGGERAAVLAEVARLRAEGHSVEYALRPQSISKQRKAASAAGARSFITMTKGTASDG